ncbi:MAG: YggT family protein [Atopobiaceae bacterium]|nr:YggT family protein [Atopobiaceae bacterium]
MVGLVNILLRLIDFYEMLIFVWVIMSWVPLREGFLEELHSMLDMLCEPFVGVFRRFIPPLGGLDFSPVIAVFALSLLSRGLVAILL